MNKEIKNQKTKALIFSQMNRVFYLEKLLSELEINTKNFINYQNEVKIILSKEIFYLKDEITKIYDSYSFDNNEIKDLEVEEIFDSVPHAERSQVIPPKNINPVIQDISENLRNEVEKLINESGIPLKADDLREMLVKKEIKIPGQQRKENIIIALTRDPKNRFIRTGRGTYGLASLGHSGTNVGASYKKTIKKIRR